MNTTFHFAKTSPTTGALVFAIGGLDGARLTANGMIAAVVERIVRDFVIPNVIPDGFARPVGHRIELHDVAPGGFVENIHLDDPDLGARVGLLPSQAGDPAI